MITTSSRETWRIILCLKASIGRRLIDSPVNRIYLPADRELGADMELSPHPSRHVSTYINAVERALSTIKQDKDASVRAAEIKTLIYAMSRFCQW